jgi:hypothetical protein
MRLHRQRISFQNTAEYTMNMDDAQKREVSRWIADGLKLADIQKRLQAEFDINLTYMEVRLLVDDLKLVPKDPAAPKRRKPWSLQLPLRRLPPPKPLEPKKPLADELEPALAATGKASVTVDALARPRGHGQWVGHLQ